MYTQLAIQYADGSMQRLETEPCRRFTARELMLYLFYNQTEDTGGSQIVSVRFFDNGKGKPLVINRSAL